MSFVCLKSVSIKYNQIITYNLKKKTMLGFQLFNSGQHVDVLFIPQSAFPMEQCSADDQPSLLYLSFTSYRRSLRKLLT